MFGHGIKDGTKVIEKMSSKMKHFPEDAFLFMMFVFITLYLLFKIIHWL
jgi:hypothetical protein